MPALVLALLVAPALLLQAEAECTERRPADESWRLPRSALDSMDLPDEEPAEPVPPLIEPEHKPEPESEPALVPDETRVALDDSAAARRLRQGIARILRTSPIGSVALGLAVADAATGAEWARVDAGRPLAPASTMKLVTGAVALDRLGPGHRFTTRVALAEPKGVRTVYLCGDGDPVLMLADLGALVERAAGRLRARGPIGRIAVDASVFTGGVLPPGFGAKTTDASYRASTGAVALDFGSVVVEAWPTREGQKPRIAVSPPGDYVVVDNQALTVAGRGSTIRIRLQRRGDRSVAVVTGRIGRLRKGAAWVRRRLEHPPLAAGHAFRHLLMRSGVHAGGAEVVLEAAPRSATEVAVHRSEPLSSIVAKMNKHSSNFIAETLLRALVRRTAEAPPASWKDGVDVVTRWLHEQVGLPRGAFAIRNGSGLYDSGRLSARGVTKLLVHMNGHRYRDAFRSSLAVSGGEGTLRSRLAGGRYRGRIIGKTGTLNQVSALSGYARSRSGRLLAFSIISNRTNKATALMHSIQDRIAALLADIR